MTGEINWLTLLVGAAIGAITTLVVRVAFDHYLQRKERKTYAAALAHEVRRIADKLDQYASSFEAMMDEYDEDANAWPYRNPPRNPITGDDFMIHRSMVSSIATLPVALVQQVLNFYDHVRDLDSVEAEMNSIDPWPKGNFKYFVKYRRELRDEGIQCARVLSRISGKKMA